MSLDEFLTMSDKVYRDAQLSQSIQQIRLLRERTLEKFVESPLMLICDHALSLQQLEKAHRELAREYQRLQLAFETLKTDRQRQNTQLLILEEKQSSHEQKAKRAFRLVACVLVFCFFFLTGFALAL